MDRLSYKYNRDVNGNIVNNKLNHVRDCNGKGAAADVGDQSTRELLSSAKFNEKHAKITTQKVEPNGFFSVDITLFTNTNKNSHNPADGFRDPNFIVEKTLGKIFDKYKPDEMGLNLEWSGGTPYSYKTRKRIYFFKPVEKQK